MSVTVLNTVNFTARLYIDLNQTKSMINHVNNQCNNYLFKESAGEYQEGSIGIIRI